MALIGLGLAAACTRQRLPEALPANVSATRAVVVQIDGLTPGLLDLYLRSAASRRPDRALAKWLIPGPADGSALTFATGQLHTARLPLPGLSDPTSVALLSGRSPHDVGVRDPGDGLAPDTPTLLTVVPRAVGVGFLTMPALETNDASRVDLARRDAAAAGGGGARLVAVRLSGLADTLFSVGLSQGPEALGRVDVQLGRLLAPPFSPEDTLLVVTSGFGAMPAATQEPVKPGELARTLGLPLDNVVPTGGLLRVAGLHPTKVADLARLPATLLLARRVGEALEIWDADLGRTRPLFGDELLASDAKARLLDWLRPGEWVAVADRARGHEFRRVGEDPARVATGGLSDAESMVPVVFAGAVIPGAARSLHLEALAPAIMDLLGGDPRALGSTSDILTEARGLADAARRTRSRNLVNRQVVVLERDAPSGLEAALGSDLPVRRRALSEGAALTGDTLAAVAIDARVVVQGLPPGVVVDTALLGAWGGPKQVTLSLEGLDTEAAAARVKAAVALADGLRALKAGAHPQAAERLRAATGLPADLAPWQMAFLYWAERAAARAVAAEAWPTAPTMPVESPDSPWLTGLTTVFELLLPSPKDGETERLSRLSRLAPPAAVQPERAPFARALGALFGGTDSGVCHPRDRVAEREGLVTAAEVFEAAGEMGLAARAWQRLTALASSAGPPQSAEVLRRLVRALGEPGAGWTRLETARSALAFSAFASPEAQGAVADELSALTRLFLLKLEQDIVSDRAPGYEARNIDRVAGFIDGSGAREPALQAEAVAFALDARADLQGRLVAALLSSGFSLPALLSGRGAESMRSLQRLVDLVAVPLPGADAGTPESLVITAVADAVAFVTAYLNGNQPVAPISADEGLSRLDLVALRNKALLDAPQGAGTSLLAWGPFIHLVVKGEVALAALATDGPPAALPALDGALDLLGRLARGEAARAGVEARLGGRIDALTAALKATLPSLLNLDRATLPPESLTAQLAALDLSPPAASDGLVGRAVALAALAARDTAWYLDLSRRGAAADGRLVAGGSELTRALMADADTANGSTNWRYFTLLLHGLQVAMQDAPRWWADKSLRNVLARSPGARGALEEIERRLRAGLTDEMLTAAFARDDLGALMRDLMAFAVSNLETIAKATGATGEADAAAERVRDGLTRHLRSRLGLAGQKPGQGTQVRATLTYALSAVLANAGKAAEVESLLEGAERLVAGTPLADNAWLFALEAFYAHVSAGRPGDGLAALERAERLCPARAWHLGLARGWAQGADDEASRRKRLEAYVAEARRHGEGGLDIGFAIEGDQGHDQYQVNLSQSVVGLLLGRRAGTFQLGAGARSGEGERVALDWAARPSSNPREAAVRAWTLMAWGALFAGDDVALDSALGRLLTALDGTDPAVFAAAGGFDHDSVPPLVAGNEGIRDPLTIAWLITLAEARGHLALADSLWLRWKQTVGAQGWAKAVEAGDFANLELCETGADEVTGPAGLACHAPRQVDLRLGNRAATRALAAFVAARVGLLVAPEGPGPDTAPVRKALVAAGKASPRLLPAWTRTLFDERAGLKAEAKAAPLPAQAAASWGASRNEMSVREALGRVHAAGGTCEAALRAALLSAPAPNPEAVPAACGAGPLYVVLLLANPQGAPHEIVTRVGRALAALQFTGDSQGHVWAERAVEQMQQILFVADEDIRAATLAQAPSLVVAARGAQVPALAITLRAFVHASSLKDGSAPTERAVDLLADARSAGVSGTPAVVFLKHLIFDAGADVQVIARAFLAGPIFQSAAENAPETASPDGVESAPDPPPRDAAPAPASGP